MGGESIQIIVWKTASNIKSLNFSVVFTRSCRGPSIRSYSSLKNTSVGIGMENFSSQGWYCKKMTVWNGGYIFWNLLFWESSIVVLIHTVSLNFFVAQNWRNPWLLLKFRRKWNGKNELSCCQGLVGNSGIKCAPHGSPEADHVFFCNGKPLLRFWPSAWPPNLGFGHRSAGSSWPGCAPAQAFA